MPGMPQRQTRDYVRHGTSSLFTAFNIDDGSVISALHRQHRAVEFRKFLIAIDKAVPTDLDVHLICGNLATHKTPAICDWLARPPPLPPALHPTGSSWINQVERQGHHALVDSAANELVGEQSEPENDVRA